MSSTPKKVILFTTPTCSHCKTAKRYLIDQKIKFKEVDVSQNPKAADDMVRKTKQQGVPQFWINNKPLVGFDKIKLNKLLEI
jgi:glutaredoxin 3